jgi:hypothetical protein
MGENIKIMQSYLQFHKGFFPGQIIGRKIGLATRSQKEEIIS